MSNMPGRLGSLKARDVMCPDLLILTENMTLEEATIQLKSRKHSGAPVVDSQRQLTGTFSLRNLTGVKQENNRGDSQENFDRESDSEIISAEALHQFVSSKIEKETVVQRMTRNPASVSEMASLIDVARLMCDFHTHRIPVTTTSGELIGIITTMDILAAVVHTADELGEQDS